MNSRILVAVVGVPALIVIVLYAPRLVLCAALCALAGLAGVELQKCVGGTRFGVMTVIGAAFPALSVLCHFRTAEHLSALWTLAFMGVFAYAVSQGGGVKFDQLSAALLAGTAVAWSFAAFLRMDAAGLPRVWLLLPFVLSFSCDSGAYLAGRSFGRHKLAPVVSPHKTVEGAVGGLLGNVVGGLVFAFLLRRFSVASPDWLWITVLSVLCGVVSQLGDLSFSLIKRQYGIKDYGRIFLAHGGVLDRFDSVLFVTPIVEYALLWRP